VLAVVLVLASVTDKLATFATNVVGDLGLPGVFLLMAAESACIPIPSEATMLFAGFNVHQGEYPLWAAVAVGSVANLVGSWIAYAVGYYGRLELLEKHGKFLHVTPSQLAWADRWFERYGGVTVFFSRMLPVIRTFISLPAGVAKMPFWKFTVLSIAGIIPWVLAWGIAGDQLGSRWDDLQEKLHYADYAIVAGIAVAIVYLILRRRRGGTRKPAAESNAP
jgi:membrane protein DedA with SNARE-associated domain